ncbi:MAG: PAS domain S-box protein [Candidatus Sericytochromatia bacterium]
MSKSDTKLTFNDLLEENKLLINKIDEINLFIKELKINNNILINTLENINEAFISINKNFICTYMNEKAGKLFNINHYEIIGKKIFDELDEIKDKEIYQTYKNALENPEFIIKEFYYSNCDKWMENRFIPLQDGGLNIFFNDITKRKKSELKLKESEEKFSKIFEVSQSMLVLTRLDDGVIVDINNAFLKVTKYSREEVVGKKFLDLNFWKNLDDRNEYLSILSKYGYTTNLEYNFFIKNKEERLGQVFGQIIEINSKKYILGAVNDITEQKKLQDSLEVERVRLKTLMNTIPDLIWLKDLDGVYLSCNNKFEALFGSKEIDIIGKTDYDFVDKELADSFRENDKIALEANKSFTNYEWLTYASDNHTELAQTIKTPMYNSKNELIGVLGVARDITELHKSQEKLKEREELYSSIVNQAQDSIGVIDPFTGKFIEFNDNAAKNLEYTREEFSELNILDIEYNFTEDEMKKFFENENRKYYLFETKHKTKSGKIKDVRVSITEVLIRGRKYHSCIWNDITNIKEFQNKLEEQKNFLELVINSIPNQLFWKDENLVYQGCNKVFADIVGFSNNKEIIGLTDYDFNRSNDHSENYRECDKKIIDSGLPIINIEEPYFNAKGEKGIVLTSKVPIKDSNNKTIGVLGICVDITELKKAKEKAEESVKLKSTFISSMSHELRTPLNIILGFSSMIEEETSLEEIYSMAKSIKDSGNDLLSIIEAVFDISMLQAKASKIKKENIEVMDIFEKFTHYLGTEKIKRNKNKINFVFKPDMNYKNFLINTDKTLLTQVITNLLNNALKFTNQGNIEYGYNINNNDITFFVKDSGIGIPKDKIDIIFEKFRQVDDSHSTNYDGVGLGLSICKEIALLLDGKIWVESEEGKGSVFYFSLSNVIEFNSIKSIKNEILDIPNLQDKVIIIAEDVELNYLLLAKILSKTKAKIIWVKNGEDVINLVKQKEHIDIIFMDIRMPKVNGYDATIEIKKINPSIYIIAQTAYALDDEKENIFKCGCNDYITKPINNLAVYNKLFKIIN